MSRKTIHRRLNPPPTITLFGDPLDRLLNGQFTDELRKQLPKMEEEKPKDLIELTIKEQSPLRAVFYSNNCRCGSKQIVFGYFCRKTVEIVKDVGEVTSYKICAAEGKPDEIQFQNQIVPYCSNCMPNVRRVME